MRFIVCGSIGVGKSHAISKLISKYSHFKKIDEPVIQWTSLEGSNFNLLQAFYDNPRKYAFRFQVYVLLTLNEIMAKYNDPGVVYVQERCPISCNIFAEALHQEEILTSDEFAIFKKLFDTIAEKSEINGYIYLQDTAQACYERALFRNRAEETRLSLDYSEKIKKAHDDFFMLKNDIDGIPLLVLRYSHDMTSENLENAIDLIAEFICKNI